MSILRLSGPAAGPASAGGQPPEEVSAEVMNYRAKDGEETAAEYGEVGQVWGESTGYILPAHFVNHAREADVDMREDLGARGV